MTTILLSDNGSTQPNATIQLRHLSKLLSDNIGKTVHPVSLQHANKIPVEKIGNTKAQVFSEFMSEKLSEGNRDYILLPLFFGNSKALTKFIPDEKVRLEQEYGKFEIRIAKPVYPLSEGDAKLVKVLADHVKQTAGRLRNIVLVDHGSPVPRVTAVRDHVANSVQEQLGDQYQLA